MRWPIDTSAVAPPAMAGVTLTDVRPEDVAPLFDVLADPVIWEYLPRGKPSSAPALAERLQRAPWPNSRRQAFVIRVGGSIVGTTSFMLNASAPEGVEIGGTYLTPRVWGTGVNGTIKTVMLEAAFAAGAEWVRLRTDERNERSARAIAKLPGAVEGERMAEPHIVRADGTVRISRVFTITRPEGGDEPT